MASFGKTVLADTGFWYALYNPRDDNHAAAEGKSDLFLTTNVLIPWPSLYETFNTRFAKNKIAVRSFEALLRQTHVELLPDEPYREAALQAALASALTGARDLSLVDMVIRLILDDINIRKHGLLTFDQKDFIDICAKRNLELL